MSKDTIRRHMAKGGGTGCSEPGAKAQRHLEVLLDIINVLPYRRMCPYTHVCSTVCYSLRCRRLEYACCSARIANRQVSWTLCQKYLFYSDPIFILCCRCTVVIVLLGFKSVKVYGEIIYEQKVEDKDQKPKHPREQIHKRA